MGLVTSVMSGTLVMLVRLATALALVTLVSNTKPNISSDWRHVVSDASNACRVCVLRDCRGRARSE